MATSIDSILSGRLGEFKPVPPLPVGTYLATITGIPKIDKMGQKQNMGVEFSFKLTQPMDDVDPDLLAQAGGVPEEPLNYTFWLTHKAAHMIQAFLLDVVGVPAGISIPDACQQVTGSQVLVTIEHKPGRKNKDAMFANISGFAKVD